MSDKELNDLLSKLHSQIEHAESLEPDQLEQLRHLEGDIRKLLDRKSSTSNSELHLATLEQLQGAIATFEISHPSIAVTFNKLMAILSNIGI